MRALLDWYKAERAKLFDVPPARGNGVLLGCPVWGADFIDNRLGIYALASVVSPRNLEALRGRCRLVLFTREADKDRVMKMLEPLACWGIETQAKVIPDAVWEWERQSEFYRYPLLGVVQSLCLLMAGRSGLGFSMFQPDHVFSEAYFENLMRLAPSHDAIIQISVSANIETACADLEKFRNRDGGELTIPDVDLGTIGWKHLHQQMRMYLMNDAEIPTRMPHSHFLLWQGRDRLRIHSCHHNPAWLSPTLCQRLRSDDYRAVVATLDTKLPGILNGAAAYVTGVDDGMMFIEISDSRKRAAPKYVDRMDFVKAAWRNVGFGDAYKQFFRQPCDVPIRPQKKGLPLDVIEDQFGQVFDLLEGDRPAAAVSLLQDMYEGRVKFPMQSIGA